MAFKMTTLTVAVASALLTTAGAAQAALVAHYQFEGNFNDTATGGLTADNGTVVPVTNTVGGTVTFVASQPGMGQAASFNGNGARGDYVSIPDSADLDLSATGMTLAAWVNVDSTDANGAFIYKGTLNAADQGRYHLSHYQNNYYILLNNNNNAATPIAPFTNDVWHHLAATYDGTSLKLYVDGTEVSSKLYSTPLSADAGQLSLGVGYNSTTSRYAGQMDDVRIYNEALSPAAIAALVPEPASMALLGLGGLLAFARRRGL